MLPWLRRGMLRSRSRNDGPQCNFAVTGKAPDAASMITSGLSAYRSTGSTVLIPWWLSLLARAYADLGRFDDAWRCIGEAKAAAETTGERWCEAESNRVAGEMALNLPPRRHESGSLVRARARSCRSATGKVLGTTRGNEHGTSLARTGQKRASAGTACSGLRLVH
jgi:predicted ATPase